MHYLGKSTLKRTLIVLTPGQSEFFSHGTHLDFLQISPLEQSESFKQFKLQNPSMHAAGLPQSSSSEQVPNSHISSLQRSP